MSALAAETESSSRKWFYNNQNQFLNFVNSGGKSLLGDKTVSQIIPQGATPNFGGQSYVSYLIKRQGDLWLNNNSKIVIVLPALTANGGTYIRYTNAVAIFMNVKFQLIVGGKQIGDDVYANQIFYNHEYFMNADQFSEYGPDIGYTTTASTRNTWASASQTLCLDLKFIFELFNKPLDLATYKDIEIRQFLQSSGANIIQYDGSAPATLPSISTGGIYIDCQYIDPHSPSITAASRQLFKAGDAFPMYDFSYTQVQQPLAAGVNTAQIQLPVLNNKQVIDFVMFMQNTSQIAGGVTGTTDYTDNTVAFTNWYLQSGGNYINGDGTVNPITAIYFTRIDRERFKIIGISNIITRASNEGMMGFCQNYANETYDNKVYHGSKDFSNITDAVMTFNFATQSNPVTITILIRSAVQLKNIGGDLLRI